MTNLCPAFKSCLSGLSNGNPYGVGRSDLPIATLGKSYGPKRNQTATGRTGYAILEDLLDPREAERLDAIARSIMDIPRDNIWGANGYVSMEGSLNHIPELAPLCIHPTILELLDMVLGENYFLANNVAMKWCKPGTHLGGLHSAGGSKPAQTFTGYPTDLQVFWMLTDFTYENGATMVVRSAITRAALRPAPRTRRKFPSLARRAPCAFSTTVSGIAAAQTQPPISIVCPRMFSISRGSSTDQTTSGRESSVSSTINFPRACRSCSRVLSKIRYKQGVCNPANKSRSGDCSYG